MNEDYLWDKSGEPDPEVQKLEEILGTLRYQPKPLELPDDVRPVVKARTDHLPWLAIAATLLIAALAGIVWFSFHTKRVEPIREAENNRPVAPSISPSPAPIVPEKKEQVADNNPTVPQPRQEYVARHIKRRPVEPVPSKEALLAKEQVMAALRLASEKLNFAEKKVQGPTPNQIRNQHKIG